MKIRLFAVLFAIALALSAFCIAAGAEGSEPTVRTYGYNLVLDNNVYIRYAIKVENPADVTIDEVGMQVWRKDDAAKKTTDLKATLQDVQGVACYVVDYTELTAKEMTDVVVSRAYIKYGGNTYYENTEREYSIVEYAKYQLGYIEGQPATEKQELIALIKDMLYYGASAQKFANYKTDNLATDFLDENRLIVRFDTDGGTAVSEQLVVRGDRVIKPVSPSKAGYTFMGWYNGDIKWDFANDLVTKDTILTARWGEGQKTFEITYDNCDEEGIINRNPDNYVASTGNIILTPPSWKGYTFQGWIMDDDWNNPVTVIDTSIARNITLHAVWSTERYSITYKNTMGVWNDNDDTYTVLDSINLRPLEKYDYTFNGWRYDNVYGDFVGEDGIPAGTTGNIVLYADWTLKPDFENMLYVVDDGYNLPNGQKFCMLTGVLDSTVTKVEISPLFNHIKEGALEDCHWLTELTLPYLGSDYTTSNYTNVGYLFGYASNAEAEGAIPTSLRKLTVKSGVIGDYAFANLKTLKEIVLSPEVTKIGYQAFSNCVSMEELTMPLLYVNRAKQEEKNGGYGLRSSEYYGLPGARGINDTTSVEYTGNMFKLHINGGGIYYGAENENDLPYENGIIGNGFGESLFQNCWGISELTIDNITVVPQFAFGRCKNIKKITIGDTVEDIRAGAFFETAIEEIVIPDSVKEWGQSWKDDVGNASRRFFAASTDVTGSVFDCCESLKKVTIGNGVVNIPTDMFRGCKNLEEVIIGENVRFVDYRAFRNCNDTFEVINHSKQKEWVISNPESERFMTQLMASENAPEKVYYVHEGNQGFKKEDGKQSVGYFTEEQIKNWHLVFYSPTEPYADGSSTDIEYWYHDDGEDWYKNQYTVTPKLWQKPQTSEGENN